MGTLEEMRDLIRELVDEGEDLALFDEVAMDWHNAGCPGYEPGPWRDPGVVPARPGHYEFGRMNSGTTYVATCLRPGVWRFGDEALSADMFDPDARFRFLCPLSTPPEDSR